jgi:hypothetical protein
VSAKRSLQTKKASSDMCTKSSSKCETIIFNAEASAAIWQILPVASIVRSSRFCKCSLQHLLINLASRFQSTFLAQSSHLFVSCRRKSHDLFTLLVTLKSFGSFGQAAGKEKGDVPALANGKVGNPKFGVRGKRRGGEAPGFGTGARPTPPT